MGVIREEGHGFYFISLWGHNKKYNTCIFCLINFQFQKYIENWAIHIVILNFDFGYIAKGRKK